MKRPRRALVLDDEAMWRYVVVEALTEQGFLAHGAANTAEARALLERGIYHLLVLDISMASGDSQNDEGMQLLGELYDTGQSQTANIIILSGFASMQRLRVAFREYGVADFFQKHEFEEHTFLETIERVWAGFQINLDLAVQWVGVPGPEDICSGLRLRGRRVERSDPQHQLVSEELEDLLCRLFHRAEAVIAQPMEGGRSGAGVLRVQPFFPEAGAGRPVIVKLGDPTDIARQSECFETYLKPFLFGGRATHLETVQRTLRLAGSIYALEGTVGDDLEGFGTFYRRSHAAEIIPILDNLFLDTCAAWYANRGNFESHDLKEEYQAWLGLPGLEALESSLRMGLKEQVKGYERLQFTSLGAERTLYNPILVIADRPLVRSTYTCITHGDLRGENILIDSQGATWLIDFLHTGRGHILRDFAQLDACVRILLLRPEEATLAERLQLEEALIEADWSSRAKEVERHWQSENPALAKALAVSLHVRKLAADTLGSTGRDDLSDYSIASLFCALDMIRRWDLPSVQREHALLSAALHAEALD